jgi:hypothetical protein
MMHEVSVTKRAKPAVKAGFAGVNQGELWRRDSF